MALWASDPFIQEKYLIVTRALEWYPPQADSIAIPIVAAFFFAVIGFPFWFLFCWLCFRRYPGAVSILAWSSDHRRYSTLITLLFGLFAVISTWSMIGHILLFREIRESDVPEYSPLAIYLALVSFGWTVLWITMRSSLVAKTGKRTTEPAVPSDGP